MENKELLQKARSAKSAEELLALAKENGMELTEEEAAEYFAQLNRSGELADDELDSVAGGGCHTNVDGNSYTVVTSGVKCFTGQYENNIKEVTSPNGDAVRAPVYTTDHASLRGSWAMFSSDGNCGFCRHLMFKGATGYCGKSGK